jgi:polygalacturonase
MKRAIASILLLATLVSAPAANFDVHQFGATGDGTTKDTVAIQKAINAASAQGGVVTFPPGRYLTGSLHLKSRVNLHLHKDATILGSTRVEDYQKLNFLGLILANNQSDIGISGEGVIDGQGKPIADAVIGPIKGGSFPDAGEAKRPVIINFRNCRNIRVSGVTLKESACWVQLYRDCDRVTIENIKVRTMAAITNDGLDIDGCTRVIIRGCDIDSEDDGICLKSSRRKCDDILIDNCRVRSSCNALKFGTASFGGFSNVTCRNLEIHDTYISAIALECVDGGVLENINISNIRITGTNNAFFLRLGRRNPGAPPGSFKNVVISDVTASIPDRPKREMNKFPPYWRHLCTTMVTSSITGLPGNPVRGVTFRNITLRYGGIGASPKPDHHSWQKLDGIPERADAYPECKIFGTLPAWGFYCRHAEGVAFENVSLIVEGADYRPALVCDDVKALRLQGFRALSAGKEPVIVLRNVTDPSIRDSPAPPGERRFIQTLER